MSTDIKTVYLITIGDPEKDGVISDSFEETLIFVGRLIEKLYTDTNFNGKYIYVTEYLCENGNYIKQDDLFVGRYLIEK
jgi:hypothetical protein